MTRVYWASWEDYYSRQLSIDYRITDNGPGTASGARVTNSTATNGVYREHSLISLRFFSTVTNSTATNGVYPTTQMPITLGNITQGSYAPFTLKYYIPVGVTGFNATVYSTCNDANGASYYYPAKRTTYAYNQANELSSGYDYQGLTTAFTYDANGALTQKSNGIDTTSYAYNGLDRLTQVTTPATSVSYAYDALGRRISRTEGISTANFHHNAKSDLTDYETDAAGNLTTAYNRGPDGMISETDYSGTPTTSYNLYNPHGDTSALTDANGAITGSYRYDAFGNAITANSLTDGYTGKWQRETDSSTGTIRMGVREYDPGLGRFTSADPLKGTPTDPQQRNRYPYVGNNPLTRYDLNGLYPGENYVETALMFGEWLTGTGPETQEFGPGGPQVEDMRNAPGIQDAIDHFYEINEGRDCNQYLRLRGRGEGFGLSGLYHAGLNPTQQFVGGYEVDITPNQDHTITITVHNTTSMSSFLYHLWPEAWNYNRINIGGIDIRTPGGNTHQTFTWTEPMR